MVVVHGSSGVFQNAWQWAKRLNELGIATFVIDNFTGRGVTEAATDQSRLSPSADVAGALAALSLIATHPAIDPRRIGVIGFSRGGSAAINSALEPIRRAVIDDDLRFVAHVALYPGCAVPFVSAHLDGSPMLMLLGGKDDYTPASFCLAYVDQLRARGGSISVVVYPDANHGSTPQRRRISIRGRRPCTIVMAKSIWTRASLRWRRAAPNRRGAEAAAELKRCTERGVTVGGDPEARKKRRATWPISSNRFSRFPSQTVTGADFRAESCSRHGRARPGHPRGSPPQRQMSATHSKSLQFHAVVTAGGQKQTRTFSTTECVARSSQALSWIDMSAPQAMGRALTASTISAGGAFSN